MPRVLVDAPPFPLELVRELLGPTGVEVEARPRPWVGDDVIGLLVTIQGLVTDTDFERLPALKVIACDSIGVDHIDLTAAARHRVWVCNVPDYCIEEVADSTIALLLSLLRGVVGLDRSVRRGKWDDHAVGPLPRLAGTRLGIIGFGRIGRAVARRAMALGLEVWATDPLVPREKIASTGVRPVRLEELLKGCTAITLHTPLTRETQGLIGEREFAMMRRGSYLINAARARLVDWDAFLAALDRPRRRCRGRAPGRATIAQSPGTATRQPDRHPTRRLVQPSIGARALPAGHPLGAGRPRGPGARRRRRPPSLSAP